MLQRQLWRDGGSHLSTHPAPLACSGRGNNLSDEAVWLGLTWMSHSSQGKEEETTLEETLGAWDLPGDWEGSLPVAGVETR